MLNSVILVEEKKSRVINNVNSTSYSTIEIKQKSRISKQLVTNKIQGFLTENKFDTPFLVVDLDTISNNYIALRRLLPQVQIYYAMKANPAPEILKLLVEFGSSFDTASV